MPVRSPVPIIAYERAVVASGGVDFDDLVLRAVSRLEADGPLLARWRSRTATLLVDEAQDLDRTQLDLALLLAGPARNVTLVGDDDQSIYGWRLADVRRVLGLASSLPGLRRVDLETNYRCPRPVVARAVRLVEHNTERFAKRILSGPAAAGRLVLAPDAADDAIRVARAMRTWPRDAHVPGRAGSDEPRAAGGGGGRAGPRDPVPGTRPAAPGRGSAARRADRRAGRDDGPRSRATAAAGCPRAPPPGRPPGG